MLKKYIALAFVFVLYFSEMQAGESYYATTPPNVIEAMLDAVDVSANDIVVDLGCGDGRIPIIAAIKYGVKSVGIERDTEIAHIARENVRSNSVQHLVSIQSGDALRTRWSNSQKVVTLYLDSELLTKLRPVLERLPVGSRIVSHQHFVPGWEKGQPIKVEDHKLYRYRVTETSQRVKVCGPSGCFYKTIKHKKVLGY